MSGRARWASRKFREAVNYHQGRIEDADKGILIYSAQAAKIRREGVKEVQWFAEFLEDVCIKDLERSRAHHAAMIEQQQLYLDEITLLLHELESPAPDTGLSPLH